jgi:hypothetical protein
MDFKEEDLSFCVSGLELVDSNNTWKLVSYDICGERLLQNTRFITG